MYVFHPTMTNPRSNNVFLKIVRFSVCHAQLALAFFAKSCSCVGVFCSPGTNCVCACKKDVRSKWLKPHFGTNSPKLAKLKHMRRNEWQVMEKWGNEKLWEHDETILSLMRQLKRYEQKIRGRENETIVCFIVFLVFPEGHNPLDHIVKTVRCRKLL